MIEEMKQKFISDPNVQDASITVLAASTGTVSAANLIVDVTTTVISLIGLTVGVIGTCYGTMRLRNHYKQSAIKTERDQLELEQYRKNLQDMAQSDEKHN